MSKKIDSLVVVGCILLICVLMFMPTGIFGEKQTDKV